MRLSSNFTRGILSLLIPGALLLISSIEKPERKPVASNSSERIILVSESKNTIARPKAPSRQQVTCCYDGQYLHLEFVTPEGQCEVTLAEWYSGSVQTYTIDTTPLTADINVGQLYESTLTITTESGNTYTANLTAE